jgi:poly(3-hydroxybutyrate) depolymerase
MIVVTAGALAVSTAVAASVDDAIIYSDDRTSNSTIRTAIPRTNPFTSSMPTRRAAPMRRRAPHSVPLIIMMHGNNNDSRIQGESAGWPEIAAANNIILASIEWQGRTSQGTAYVAIGEKGTMTVLDLLLAKYPQIDPSRGLSDRSFRRGYELIQLGSQ